MSKEENYKIIKLIERMEKYDTGDRADPFFSEPRAYNQALSDLKAKIKQL